MTRTILFLLLFSASAFVAQAQDAGEIEGLIYAREGDIVKVVSEDSPLPPAGMQGEFLKHFEEKLGKMTMNGWLNVGVLEIVSVEGQNMKLRIIEEKSEILVDGEKVDHFKVGKRVKFQWPLETEKNEK